MMRYKILKICAFLIGTVLALVLMAIIGLQIYLETGAARRMIQDRINRAIPGQITWDRHHLSIFKGRLVIENAQVRGIENDAIISAELLSIDIQLTDLLKKGLLIKAARLEKPSFFLQTDAEGRLNLIRAFSGRTSQSEPGPESGSENEPFNLRINELTLEEGRVSYGMIAAPSMTEAKKLQLQNIRGTFRNVNWRKLSGEVDITMGGGSMDMGGSHIPIHGFGLSAILVDGRLDPLNLAFGTADSRIELSGAVTCIFDKPSLDLKLTLAANLSEIRQIFRVGTELSGILRLDMIAKGSLENPVVTLDLNYTGGRLAGMDVSKIVLGGRMQDRKIAIHRLNAEAAQGKLESSGLLDLQSAFADGFLSSSTDLSVISYRINLNSSEIQLSAFPGMANISGELTSSLHLEGRGISKENLFAEASVDIHGRSVAIDKIFQPLDMHINGRAELTRKGLVINPVTIETQEAQLKVSGQYEFSAKVLKLTATAGIPDLKSVLVPLGISDISGKNVMLLTEITGPAWQPKVDACLNGTRLAYKNFLFGDLSANVNFKDGGIDIQSLDMKNGKSKISMKGNLQVLDKKSLKPLADPGIDLVLNAFPFHLEDFTDGVSGQIKIAGHMGGSFNHPEGSITLKGSDLDLGVQTVDTIHLSSNLEGRKIFIEPLEISLTRGQSLRAQGWVSLDQAYELRLDSDPIAFETINSLADTDLGGRISLTASGAGGFNNPQLNGQVLVSELTVGQKNLPEMKVELTLKDKTVHIKTAEPLTIDVLYDLIGHDFSAKAMLSDTELAPFFQIAGRQDLGGKITATLESAGSTENLDHILAKLSISELRLLRNEKELISTNDFAATLKNGIITVPGNRFALLKEGHLFIQGTGALDGQLDFSANGYIPAALTETLVSSIDQPEGGLDLTAQIKGTINQPNISGSISFKSVGLAVTDTRQKLHDINGRIDITDRAITVSGLRGHVDGGEFILEGRIDMENFAPTRVNLELSAQALPINIDKMLEMRINTYLKLAGSLGNSSLTGNIFLLDGRYFKDVNLSLLDTADQMIKHKRQTTPRPETKGAGLPFLKKIALDVSVSSRNPFIVDNNMALLNINPMLRIHGTGKNPIVSGRAQVSQGTIIFQNTEFEVKRGVIDFVNPYRIEPTVDIRAESQVREWLITLMVSGTPENLDFKLSSIPSLADADIISLLAVGRTTQELASRSRGAVLSPEEMLANAIAGKIAKQVKEQTGLDIVELENRRSVSEGQDEDEVKVILGKELSRRLTVKYGAERKSGTVVQQSSAIYKILENLSVNAFQDTQGAFGGEMRYRLEFR